jgi:hypothetical protein
MIPFAITSFIVFTPHVFFLLKVITSHTSILYNQRDVELGYV